MSPAVFVLVSTYRCGSRRGEVGGRDCRGQYHFEASVEVGRLLVQKRKNSNVEEEERR